MRAVRAPYQRSRGILRAVALLAAAGAALALIPLASANQIPFRGVEADREGAAAWNANGSGPEAVKTALAPLQDVADDVNIDVTGTHKNTVRSPNNFTINNASWGESC